MFLFFSLTSQPQPSQINKVGVGFVEVQSLPPTLVEPALISTQVSRGTGGTGLNKGRGTFMVWDLGTDSEFLSSRSCHLPILNGFRASRLDTKFIISVDYCLITVHFLGAWITGYRDWNGTAALYVKVFPGVCLILYVWKCHLSAGGVP